MNEYTKSCKGCIYLTEIKKLGQKRCILGKMKLNCKEKKEG